jgi:exodeoxyribonuclease VII large subunit
VTQETLPTTTSPAYITVSDLNRKVKQTLAENRQLQSVWVVGELSNVRKNVSPHLFPKLKDEKSEIGLVIWGDIAEEFAPVIKEGAKVLVHGTVRVYEPRGVYQVYVDEVRELGLGELFAKFEELKKKLKAEGLFEQKRDLPKFPQVVGVVTSETGAVIHDIIRNLTGRFPPVHVVVAPVQVQGQGAAEDIASGIRALNALKDRRPDLLIVGRGGGSLEDLWAFNEEAVARALFESKIPTISAVGHQTDFTIADFVADRRAATPTEAAVDAVPDKGLLLQELANTEESLANEVVSVIEGLEERAARAADLLESLNPERILHRGYSVVTLHEKHVTSITQISAGDSVSILMQDGSFDSEVIRTRRRK